MGEEAEQGGVWGRALSAEGLLEAQEGALGAGTGMVEERPQGDGNPRGLCTEEGQDVTWVGCQVADELGQEGRRWERTREGEGGSHKAGRATSGLSHPRSSLEDRAGVFLK